MCAAIRCVCCAALLAAELYFSALVRASHDNDGWKEQVRSAACLNLSRIHSMDVHYELTARNGGVSAHRLVISGTMARDDKDELRKGAPPAGLPQSSDLYSYRHAFNNLRSQFMEPGSKAISLKDGNEGFHIPWTTPVTFPYSGWLKIDPPLRWDKIASEAAWEKSFSAARLAQAGNENVVIFPQDDSCDLVVTFNPEAMYLPVQVDRIRRISGVVEGRLTVRRWVRLGGQDQPFCVATDIVSEVRSGNSQDLIPDYRLALMDRDLHVNQPIDNAVFTLDIPKDFQVYDVDEVNRYASTVKQINKTESKLFSPPPASGDFGYGTLYSGLAIVLLGTAAFAKWWQKRH